MESRSVSRVRVGWSVCVLRRGRSVVALRVSSRSCSGAVKGAGSCTNRGGETDVNAIEASRTFGSTMP
jgi:hypothetical protein